MQKLLLFILILFAFKSQAQFFKIRNPYTGGHFAFSRFNPIGINRFVVQFNNMWRDDIRTGFHQYSGGELGQTFSTSGMRFVWGSFMWGDIDMKWTASTDYAIGFGKDKNEVTFKNGMTQIMNIRMTNNQINSTFGVSMKEDKFWLEALYCTNLGRAYIEYATIHQNGVESYGTEYKLNGHYKGLIRTMEIGLQTSYRRKKTVMYARVLYPLAVLGPGKADRRFIDKHSSHLDPKDFPSDYESYVHDPVGHVSRNENLQTSGFKGLSYGFGLIRIIGKIHE